MFKLTLTLVSLALALHVGSQDPVPASASQPPAPKVPIQYEDGVLGILEVTDVKAAARWYGDVLGSRIHFDLSEMGWIEVTSPVEGANIGLSQPSPGKELETNGGSAIGFGVEDIESVAKWLTSKDVRTEELVVIPETVKLLTFYDPDGNSLLFYESIP